ncbi:MAG: hypothetical protein K2J25_04605 [Oscillospiraceae bacterium]|nr:hypothetical protein [Oscillospiraceae bacterium]
MEEIKEETRIVITYDSENRNASTYLNNPNVDTETHVIMLCSHINLVIKNLMLSGMQFCEAVATAQKAVTIATDRLISELVEENSSSYFLELKGQVNS